MVDSSADFLAARDVCKKHAKSFYFCSFFLPKRKRLDAYAVYAFCRMLDDAVDENPGRETEGVALFEATLDRVYSREPIHIPALRAFAAAASRLSIPKQHFLDLTAGCRMDLTVVRYATWAELERYCYHVAGVVGLIMCRVFGLQDEAALKQGVQMGNAMQLTNILRDVREDFERGRVYLPADELVRFGVSEDDLAGHRVSPGFVELMKFQIARARSMYEEAAAGLVALDLDGSRQTACAMGVIYAGILGAIERQRYDVFARRARLNFAQKIARLPRARRLSRASDSVTVRRAFT